VSTPILCRRCEKQIPARPRPNSTFLCTLCGHVNDNPFDVYAREPLRTNVIAYAQAVITTPAGVSYSDSATVHGIDPEVTGWDVLVALGLIVWSETGGWVAGPLLPTTSADLR
jgi:hypothetical protein